MQAANDNGRDGYVYVITSTEQKAFKVGYTSSGVRIHNLQTGNPAKLTLMRQIPATKAAERGVHAALSDFIIRGEWFTDSGLANCLVDDLLNEFHGCQQDGRVLEESDAFKAAKNAVRYFRLGVAA